MFTLNHTNVKLTSVNIRGGSNEAMAELNRAREQAYEECAP